MSTTARSMATAAYALFALEQPIGLGELAASAATTSLPLASTKTPEWFAAAAHQDYDLMATAPELLVLPTDLGEAERVDVTGLDLIHVYAPELVQAMAAPSAEPTLPPAPVAVPVEPAAPERLRTSTQLGLLKELGDLDG